MIFHAEYRYLRKEETSTIISVMLGQGCPDNARSRSNKARPEAHRWFSGVVSSPEYKIQYFQNNQKSLKCFLYCTDTGQSNCRIMFSEISPKGIHESF